MCSVGPFLAAIVALAVALFGEALRHRIFGPKLDVTFDAQNPACKAHTTIGPKTGPAPVWASEAYYVRVKVENEGRGLAKSCRAFLVKVEEANANGEFKETIYADSLQLKWSCRSEGTEYDPIDLPKGVPQFVDVVSTDKKDAAFYIHTSPPPPNRYESLFKVSPHRRFRFAVLIGGDGVEPKSTMVIFEWCGAWDNFKLAP